jgi:hypothetical protein
MSTLHSQKYSTDLVLHTVKEERNVLQPVKRRKDNCFGHILRRNCLLKPVTEGQIEERLQMTGRRERIPKQLLDDQKAKKMILENERGSHRYQSVENSLSKTLWPCRKTDYKMTKTDVDKQHTEK